MSTFSVVGVTDAAVSFRVIERDECIFIEGSLPSNWLQAISAMIPGAVLDSHLARMMGVNFAIGLPDDIEACKAAKIKEINSLPLAHNLTGLSNSIVRWLATGERGASSETMLSHLAGVDCRDLDAQYAAHPHDPDDLRRCMLLLDQCPELVPLMPKMSSASKQWAALVAIWPELTATMLEEIGSIHTPRKGASAPRTYKLIKDAIGE